MTTPRASALSLFAAVLATSALLPTRSFALEESTRESRRMSQLSEQLDENFLRNRGVSYYFQILEKKTRVPLGEEKFQNHGDAYAQLASFDFERNYERALAENDHVHIMITKMAYVVSKDISFYQNHWFQQKFWNTVRPELNLESTSRDPNALLLDFKGTGSSFVPKFDMKLGLFSTVNPNVASNQPIQTILSLDPEFGAPALVQFENYKNFGKVWMKKTSLQNVTVTKYYSRGPGQTLAISYSVSYIYALVPGMMGGVEKMRSMGVSELLLALDRIDALTN